MRPMRRSVAAVALAAALVTGDALTFSPAAAASAAVPAPVSSVVAHAGITSVLLSWTNPRSSALHDVMIRRARGRVAPTAPSRGTFVADVRPPTHSVKDSGLVRNATYTYALFARNRYGHYQGVTTRVVRLAPSQAVAGRVTHAASPVANVHVTTVLVDSGKPGPSGYSRSDGSYLVVGLRADTDYAVCFDPATASAQPATGLVKRCIGSGAGALFVPPRSTRQLNPTLRLGGEVDGTVRDTLGEPLAGVAISIGSDSLETQPTRSRTAADGSYRLRGLGPGRYTLCFDPVRATGGSASHGYAPQCLGGEPFDVLHGQSDGASVPVSRGVVTGGVNQTLIPHPTITGTVTGAAGAPLPGVKVTLTIDGDYNDAAFSATTDMNGTYVLRWDGDDNDRMCFAPPASTHYGRRCFDYMLGIEPSPGLRTGADQSFAIPSGSDTIIGKVTDSAGHPLPGVTVTSQSDVTGADAVTAADGTYRIAGLNDATYDTLCFTPGSATQALSSTGFLPRCVTGIDHDSTATTTVNTTLKRGGAVSGYVTDTSGHPLPNLLVEINAPDAPAFARTSKTGHYRLSGLPPSASYTVVFLAGGAYDGGAIYAFYHGGPSATGYEDQCWRNVTPYNQCTPVAIAGGKETTGISAKLRRAGGVSGTVTDKAGHPLRHVRVDIYRGGFDDWELTDYLGHYKGILLRSGAYSVCFTGQPDTTPRAPQGYVSRCYKGAAPPATSVTVYSGRITTGIDVHLATTPVGSISGSVTDTSGSPVVGAVVTSDGRSAATGTDGSYHLTGVGTGTVRVCATFGSHTSAAEPAGLLDACHDPDVTVHAGLTTAGVNFQLAPAAEIAGTIADSAEVPLSDVVVAVYATGQDYPLAQFYSDAHGRYRATGLPPGSYQLYFSGSYVTGPGTSGDGIDAQWSGGVYDRTAAAVVAAPAAQVTPYNVSLVSDGAVAGTARDDEGNPVQAVHVALQSSDGQSFGYGITAADGTYRVIGLRPGTYTACFTLPTEPLPTAPYGATVRCYGDTGDGTAGTIIVDSALDTSGVDAAVIRNGAVEVTVTDQSTGHVLSGATVTITETGQSAATDDTGVADLTGIAPNNYTIHVDGQNATYPGGNATGYGTADSAGTVTAGTLTTIAVELAANS